MDSGSAKIVHSPVPVPLPEVVLLAQGFAMRAHRNPAAQVRGLVLRRPLRTRVALGEARVGYTFFRETLPLLSLVNRGAFRDSGNRNGSWAHVSVAYAALASIWRMNTVSD